MPLGVGVQVPLGALIFLERIKKVMKTIILLATVLVFAGCTDAERAKIGGLGNKATVTCYSGGKEVYQGRSTGKVSNEQGSDGYFLRDSARGKLVEVSGQCIVEYDN